MRLDWMVVVLLSVSIWRAMLPQTRRKKQCLVVFTELNRIICAAPNNFYPTTSERPKTTATFSEENFSDFLLHPFPNGYSVITCMTKTQGRTNVARTALDGSMIGNVITSIPTTALQSGSL